MMLIAYLAKKEGQTVSLMEVAAELNLPYRFLGQLATALKGAGVVESKEGKSGGYSLKHDWQKKSLYELLEGLGENKHMVKCLGTGITCAREADCQLRKIWRKMEESFSKELKLIKLSEI